MAQILVVDDEAAIRAVLEKMLSRWNHETLTAVNGLDALEQCRKHVPDLAMVDLYMPGMNGLQFLSAAKDEFPDLPVIAMTGQPNSASLVSLAAAKCFGSSILRKPFDVQQISILVCDALGLDWESAMTDYAATP